MKAAVFTEGWDVKCERKRGVKMTRRVLSQDMTEDTAKEGLSVGACCMRRPRHPDAGGHRRQFRDEFTEAEPSLAPEDSQTPPPLPENRQKRWGSSLPSGMSKKSTPWERLDGQWRIST